MRDVLNAAAIAASAILVSFALPAVGVRAEELATAASPADSLVPEIPAAAVTKTNMQTFYRRDPAGRLLGAAQGSSTEDAQILSISAATAGFEEEKAYWIKTLGDEH